MPLGKKKLYAILSIASMAGYAWLSYGLINYQQGNDHTVGVCIIKSVTNIPCPSCGSTRAIIKLLQGNLLESLYTNPFGIIILTIMLVLPLWILFDLSTKKQSLYDFYFQAESYLKRRIIAIPLITLVIMNWIWNIMKGL